MAGERMAMDYGARLLGDSTFLVLEPTEERVHETMKDWGYARADYEVGKTVRRDILGRPVREETP